MEITINNQAADIAPDNEKTVGEIMAGLEQWLANIGQRISGLAINSKLIPSSEFEEIFRKDVTSVNMLDIKTISLAELFLESLLNLQADTEEFENLKFDEKREFLKIWEKRPHALFTLEQMPDIHNIFINLFSGEDMNAKFVSSVIEERLREVKEPLPELNNLKPLLDEICAKLANLALDIQTGKDAQAAKTIQVFSGLSEKMLRIIRQLDIQGILSQEAEEKEAFSGKINEFGKLIKELLEAYEKHDTVLVGDLAEYEASPKLQELYSVIMNNSRQAQQQEVK
ncbi:MAG: hypothetical protein LBC76_11890 [Treponema sp.]|jgi:hypothetical protein|nr:hypothetical protein [Treponema sp.]